MFASRSIQQEIETMPSGLRALLEAELAAGNTIAEMRYSFPAPPVGACFKLTKPLQTRAQKSGEGIDYYDRDNANYSGEITDAQRCYFLLEPPHPPDADPKPIRPQVGASPITSDPGPAPQPVKYRPVPNVLPTHLNYRVELDVRGESLIYHEADRFAYVICTFSSPPCIVPRTLSNWNYTDGKRYERMDAAERAALLEKIADYCRKYHHMEHLVFES